MVSGLAAPPHCALGVVTISKSGVFTFRMLLLPAVRLGTKLPNSPVSVL